MTRASGGQRPERELHPLSEALDEVLAGLQPTAPRRAGSTDSTSSTSASRTVGGVFGRWEEAVGPQVAGHARPVKLVGGKLLVEVDEPGWASQLRYLEADLLARISAVAGPGVESIEFRVRRR